MNTDSVTRCGDRSRRSYFLTRHTQKFLTVTVWADPTGAMFYQMDGPSAATLIEAARKEKEG
jgi:hypothetical protein